MTRKTVQSHVDRTKQARINFTYVMLGCACMYGKKEKEISSIITLDIMLLQCTSGQKHAGQSNYSDLRNAIKSSVSSSTSLLFVPRDHLKRLCLLLVLLNKQRQAELEQWLEKSTNPRQDMSALGLQARSGSFGKGESTRLKDGGWMWGGAGGRPEVWTRSRQGGLSQFSLPYPSWEHHFYFLFITGPISSQSFQTTVE